jgi:hypothetical protein
VGIAARWATDTAFDLWQLSHPIKNRETSVHKQQWWQPPEPEWIKYNVDATFQAGTARWYKHCLNALAAEAMACCYGLLYAKERGVRKVKMESDCQVWCAYGQNVQVKNPKSPPYCNEWKTLAGASQLSF